MKKQIVLFFMACVTHCAQCQTGPLLVGNTLAGGANNAGTVLRYTGGDTVVSGEFSFPANSFLTGPYNSTLTETPGGRLYGLAVDDGGTAEGTLFEYNYSANNYTVMVTFDSATGYNPIGALLLASNGLLYGLTSMGDSTNGGTLFSYAIGSNTVTKLITLDATANPRGSLIQASNGKLYGLTFSDGANSGGTIFQYDINSNSYSLLVSLPAFANPTTSLLEVGADTLYGLTEGDGTNNGGTLFRYVIGANSDTVLYNFSVVALPGSSLLHATNGKLYGLTSNDGATSTGTIFSYSIDSGTYNDLHDFGLGNDGAVPDGGFMQATDGMLYAMTSSGGTQGVGTIFRYDINSSAYTLLVNLVDSTGITPDYGTLTQYIEAPQNNEQPALQITCAGSMATYKATASGLLFTTQWQVSTDSGATFSNINGATDSTYTFTTSSSQNGYEYRAVFTNIGGADTSSAALLLVTSINDSATVSGSLCTAAQTGATSYQWLDCNTGQAIGGATTQTYQATHSSSYECALQLGTGCVDTTNCVSAIVNGIEAVENYNFNLYPNPNPGSFVIDYNYAYPLHIQIVNALGKVIMEQFLTAQGQQFDISNLAAGLYQVMILDDKQLLKGTEGGEAIVSAWQAEITPL